jgi:undecaprenyl-diphosphatase
VVVVVLPLGLLLATGYSYPSGHASGTAAMVTVLVLVFWPVVSQARRWVFAALAIAAAAVVGYTRVALGVHFSSDVVAGVVPRRRVGAVARGRPPGLAGPA